MGGFLSKPRHQCNTEDTQSEPEEAPRAHETDVPGPAEPTGVERQDREPLHDPNHPVQPRMFGNNLLEMVRTDPKAQFIIEQFTQLPEDDRTEIVHEANVRRATELVAARNEYNVASQPARGRNYRRVGPRLPPLMLTIGARVPSGLLNKARYPPLTEEQVISMIYNHPFYQHQVYGVDRSRRDLEFLRSVSHVHGTLRSDRQLTWIDDLRKRAEEAAHFL
jgi:hypothetical protein